MWGLGLVPLARVAWWVRDGVYGLGANPIERVLHHSGWWTLTLLMVALAITPLRRITGWNELIKLRRPLGLFAFFWATVHLGIYLGLDQLFAWDFIIEDIVDRPFITVGFAAWVILVPLAVTSTKGWIRRLGKRWTILHRGVYLAAVLGVIHYYWRVKADTREPLIFAAVLVALMALRMRWTARRRRGRPVVAEMVKRGEESDASDGVAGAGTFPGAGGSARAGAGTG